MQYIFFGTPKYSANILEQLIAAGFMPKAVVCNPDRPVGKKKIITPPPTKIVALSHTIPVFQPNSKIELDALALSLKADFAIVAYYYQILSPALLSQFRLGTIGVHYSFLPQYRGATPVQTAILNNDSTIGISFYLIDEQLDHGLILKQVSVPVQSTDTYLDLENKLTPIAAKELIKLIPDFIAGTIKPKEQDHTKATFTKKFTTKDAEVDMSTTGGKNDAPMIYRKIKALNPEPGVWTINFPGREGKRVKLLTAKFSARGGENNELKITQIQVAGKKPQTLT